MKCGRTLAVMLAAGVAIAFGLSGSVAMAQPGVQMKEPTGQPGAPPIVFEPASLELGVGKPGEKLKRDAVIRNTGTTPLKITKYKGSCSCTVPTLDRDLIPPGETATMSVVLDPGWLPIKQSKMVQVWCEGFARPAVLSVLGEVSLPLRVERPVEKLSVKDPVARFWIESVDGASFRVLRVNGKAQDEALNPVSNGEAAARHQISYAFGEAEIPNYLVIETDLPAGCVGVVRMDHPDITRRNAEFRSNWRIERTFVSVDCLSPGETIEFVAPISGILADETPRLVCDDERLEIKYLDKAETAGKRGWFDLHLSVTIKDGAAGGMINTPMEIRAADSDQVVRTFLIGSVTSAERAAHE